MGHKINPVAFRLGIQKDWSSRWYSEKNRIEFLRGDFAIRELLKKKLVKASVDGVDIVRSGNSISISIRSARPGMIIGRGGKGLDELQQDIKKVLGKISAEKKQKLNSTIKIEIEEIKKPELFARLIAKNICEQLEKRIPFRRAMKMTIEKVMSEPVIKGMKVLAKGRLGGAEIARKEQLTRGKIPLQNLRADIDYAHEEANTTYGAIGVKVWLYKGDKFEEDNK